MISADGSTAMTEDQLAELFMPHIVERRSALTNGMRLVHYTSAEGAHRIITGKQMWLRNAQLMNDFSEIQHGLNCLYAAWNSQCGKDLQGMIDRVKGGLRNEIAALFDGHTNNLRTQTYITCVSEHRDEEDQLGRLSMWRAYGGRNGVALVLNNSAFDAETDEMQVYSSPVFYQSVDDFTDWFSVWSKAIVAAEDALCSLGGDVVQNWLFASFRSFALCTKHPAFAEEREWRVFHSPAFEGASDWIEPANEVVHGVPQPVMKLILKDDPARGVTGVAPATLVERLIIGPSEYPLQIFQALAAALDAAGVQDPGSKIFISNIPLRSQ